MSQEPIRFTSKNGCCRNPIKKQPINLLQGKGQSVFHHKKQSLAIKYPYTTDIFQKTKLVEYLDTMLNIYDSKCQVIIKAFETLEDSMLKIQEKIRTKYGEQDPRYMVLNDKLLQLKKELEFIKYAPHIKPQATNREVSLKLEAELKMRSKKYYSAIFSVKRDSDMLAKYSVLDSLFTKFKFWLGLVPTKNSDLNSGIKKSLDIMNTLPIKIEDRYNRAVPVNSAPAYQGLSGRPDIVPKRGFMDASDKPCHLSLRRHCLALSAHLS